MKNFVTSFCMFWDNEGNHIFTNMGCSGESKDYTKKATELRIEIEEKVKKFSSELEQPDPQAEIALRRLNDKSDKIVSMKAMEKAVKVHCKNNCPTAIGARRFAK